MGRRAFSSAGRFGVLLALVSYDSRTVHGSFMRPSNAQHIYPIPQAQTYSNIYLHEKHMKIS